MTKLLLQILSRVAESGVALGNSTRQINAAIRKRALISNGGKDIGAAEARNIRRRAETRVRAAQSLTNSNTIPNGFRYPRCPEYASMSGEYFATVFIDAKDNKTGVVRRVRIPVSSNTKLSATEIIDQAIMYAENFVGSSRHQFDTNDYGDSGITIDHNSAQIGSVCRA